MTDDPYQAGQQPDDLPRYPSFNPWAAPDSGRQPYGPGASPPRSRSRVLAWVAAIVVVAVLFTVVGGGLLLARHHSSSVGTATPVAPQPSSAPSGSTAPSGSATPSASPTGPAVTPSPSGQPSGPAAGAAPDVGSGPLDKYVLSPAEDAPGAVMFLIDGGRGVTPDDVTLDFCNFTYTSEKLRTARVQVQYAGGTSKPVGNEFVKYQPGGTTKAFAELQQALASCPATTQSEGVTYSQVLRAPRESGLVSHQLILSFQVNDPSGGVALPWQAVVYQFDGNYFSGVYTYGTTRALALSQAERLALLSAHHLAEAVAGKPGTGGGPFATFAAPTDNGVQV